MLKGAIYQFKPECLSGLMVNSEISLQIPWETFWDVSSPGMLAESLPSWYILQLVMSSIHSWFKNAVIDINTCLQRVHPTVIIPHRALGSLWLSAWNMRSKGKLLISVVVFIRGLSSKRRQWVTGLHSSTDNCAQRIQKTVKQPSQCCVTLGPVSV